MSTKLFVGSLSYGVDDDQLKNFFSAAGQVVSATVIKDRDSGRSKGFGFVEMSSAEEAKAAIEQLNNQELDNRRVTVSEARPREDRPRGFSGNNDRRNNFGGGQRY